MLVYDMGAMKQLVSIPGTSRAINTELITKFLANFANVCVTSQGHGFFVDV